MRAASLAAEITEQTGLAASAVEGVKSQFDVVADGEVVFSKQGERRWPEPGEVVAALSAR